MKFNLLSSSSQHCKSILYAGKHTKYHRNIATTLKRLFSPVYTSPDKLLNGKNVHGSAFRLHGTRGTKQIFERQTVLQSVTEFEQFRVKGVAQVKFSLIQQNLQNVCPTTFLVCPTKTLTLSDICSF